MTPTVQLMLGDCLDVLPAMAENSIDSIVCDPPYGLSEHRPQDIIDCLRAWLDGEPYKPNKKGFMGKGWDGWVAGPEVWREALRVLKPGGHLLCFAGTRSMDLVSMAIRLAGFELRDSIGYAHDGGGAPLLAWLHGQGFPKSLAIDKAIDKAAGAEREVIGSKVGLPGYSNGRDVDESGYGGGWKNPQKECAVTAPATDAAKQWDGWGTALKPAWEPIILAMKPLDGTFANNALKWGVAGLNVDACRIGTNGNDDYGRSAANANGTINAHNGFDGKAFKIAEREGEYAHPQGRWPANVLLDEESAALLDQMSGERKSGGPSRKPSGHYRIKNPNDNGMIYGKFALDGGAMTAYSDIGGAARFFYCAKASRSDRNSGLDGASNGHPTVKPTALCRYLVRLVTPPGGTVLDPFLGSGSTLKAAKLEGFNGVGIELDAEYLAIAQRRIDAVQPEQAQLPMPFVTEAVG